MYAAGTKFVCYRVSPDIDYTTPPKVGEIYTLLQGPIEETTRAWLEMQDTKGNRNAFKLKDLRLASSVQAGVSDEVFISECKPTQIKCRLKREKGNTYLLFKVGEKIEEMYKGLASEKQDSSNWPGMKFYRVPNLLENRQYQDLLRQYGLYDDYGQVIFASGRLNIAWIRSVGGTGKIKINDLVSLAQLSDLMKGATSFIKTYFEEYYRDCCISGEINIVL
jgi:hypothetical protein